MSAFPKELDEKDTVAALLNINISAKALGVPTLVPATSGSRFTGGLPERQYFVHRTAPHDQKVESVSSVLY